MTEPAASPTSQTPGEAATPAPRTLGRAILRWVVPALALATSITLSYGAYTLASYSWDQVVSYESPYTSMSGADFSGVRPSLTEPIPGAESRRVVMVLIDGLRDDASRTMASVSALRARGADVRLTVPQPSLSYPTWTTIMTGAPQQISGVTTNWFEGPVSVETLLDVAAASGRTVAVAGPQDLDDMFRASEVATASALEEWSEDEYRSGAIVDDALALDAQLGGADFLFVLLPDVDNAGHDFGGASAEYADVVAKVDADLGRLIEGTDDGETVYVVLPDHGHIDTGGHGGWEDPVIHTFAAFAGPGVAETTADAHLSDIAPTVAVLAGMQAPLQATGTAIDAVLADGNGSSRDAEFVRSAGITLSYVRKVLGDEGVIDIGTIASCEGDATNVVTLTVTPIRLTAITAVLERRGFVSQTSCGICGKELVEDLSQMVRVLPEGPPIDLERAHRCLEDLEEQQTLYQPTRGSHAAAIYSSAFEFLSMAEDVGRHNALDKAIGKALLDGRLPQIAFLIMSSRLSYELIQKAARARIPIILSVSRPTGLAVELAARLNMGIACLAPGEGVYIFSGHERFRLD